MRLFISNSKSLFVIIFLCVIIVSIIATEVFYRHFNIPPFIGFNHDIIMKKSEKTTKQSIFILGDSRAELGIIPELIDKKTSYDSYNLGLDGLYIGYQKLIEYSINQPSIAIITVSPYSVFKTYDPIGQLKPKQRNPYSEYLSFIKSPSIHTEKTLSNLINRKSRLHYGFSGFSDVFHYRRISEHYSSKGWHCYNALGSDEKFTRAVNYFGYKHKLLEHGKDSVIINKSKNAFESVINHFHEINTRIIMVRIPTSKEIRNIEEEKFPWFSDYMSKVSLENGIEYFDFTNFSYMDKYSDGSHLNQDNAQAFTQLIIKIINSSN